MGIFGFLADIVGLNFRKNRERKNLKVLIENINNFCKKGFDIYSIEDYLKEYDQLILEINKNIEALLENRTDKSSKIYSGLQDTKNEFLTCVRPNGDIKDILRNVTLLSQYERYVLHCYNSLCCASRIRGGRLSVWTTKCSDAFDSLSVRCGVILDFIDKLHIKHFFTGKILPYD